MDLDFLGKSPRTLEKKEHPKELLIWNKIFSLNDESRTTITLKCKFWKFYCGF